MAEKRKDAPKNQATGPRASKKKKQGRDSTEDASQSPVGTDPSPPAPAVTSRTLPATLPWAKDDYKKVDMFLTELELEDNCKSKTLLGKRQKTDVSELLSYKV
jgi:hypothetical protein